MKYLSEILKIIEHGANGNTDAVKDYANLLSKKMGQDGLHKESEMVYKRAHQMDLGELIFPVKK